MPVPVPGNPHPDVFILVHCLQELTPGSTILASNAAKAIGVDDEVLVRRRMTAARKIALRDYGINMVAVPKVGWHRETPSETAARMNLKEVPSFSRKARRTGKQLEAIDTTALTPDEKAGYFGTRTIVNILGTATAPASRKRFAAAAQKSMNVTPMADALKLLVNGDTK